jgi:hypothetical protein
MPIELVLADIKQKLQAERVWLPSSGEVDACKDKTAETVPEVDSAEVYRNRPTGDLDTEGLGSYLLNPEAESWVPESLYTDQFWGSRRNPFLHDHSFELQDANLSQLELLRRRVHSNRRYSRRLDAQDSFANADDSSYYGIDSRTVQRHRDAGHRGERLTSRPPVSNLSAQPLSSNHMPYSPPTLPYSASAPICRPGPYRNAMPYTSPAPPYYTSFAPYPPPQPALSNYSNPYSQPYQSYHSQIGAQATYIGMAWGPANMPPNNMAPDPHMAMYKHGTDSGYASRAGSQQASPVPSPPQPRSKNNSSNDVDISVEYQRSKRVVKPSGDVATYT